MDADIHVETLIRFETADDGSSITLIVEDFAGRTTRLLFPVSCLTSLLMTLPGMLTSAIQQARRDSTLRVVFPVGRFEVELGAPPGTLILTLATTDGFSVSFSLSEAQYHDLGNADMAEARPPGATVRLN